ncbi:MAG: SEL1-like repeat protein [Verrucomicrobia bacterium]|nr:SEL1-like repeat protein [Verrucomicrobiota bacterium]
MKGLDAAFGATGGGSKTEAAEWFRKAAENGHPGAQVMLGTLYFNGEGVTKDAVEAVKWFRQAAEQDHAEAQFNFGYCYTNGEGVSKDEIEAVKWFHKAAEQNHAEAQYSLGVCYANGNGVTKDLVEAVNWYRKAADQNCAEAQFHLGISYVFGQGVTKDAVEAAKWYRRAAEQNFAKAQFFLGVCYANGLGVVKDQVETVKWYHKAAEQNVAKAQFYLGVCYANGNGVSKDLVEAVNWYRKAADQNDALAQANLGVCYANGLGVAKSQVEAVKWFRKSAEQNVPRSQFLLGGSYYYGLGVAKDYVEAYKWFLLAAGQGDESAKKFIPGLEHMMTRAQVAEGQALARNFKPREVPAAGNDSSSTGIAQTRPASSGTGFFITDDGYFITNEHVAGNGAQVRLVTATGLISAKVVKVDAANDIALLKAEGKFTALPVSANRAVKLGGTVATVGFPNIGLQGFAPKLAKGEIASLSGAADDARYFQISVPVQPGNSGGALVDERGNVVGVVSAKLNARAALAASGTLPENVNYAVKSSFLLGFLESVPEVSAKLKEPNTKERKFEDVVKFAEQAAVLVLVY